ncbi:MAG: hypothetical protein ACQESP_04450 [Candidatus Muiribacteriota bacterium]
MLNKILKLILCLFIFSIIIFIFSKLSIDDKNNKEKTPEEIVSSDEIVICLDPGHGGKPEYGNRYGGDQWSFENKTFNSFYNYGAYYKGMKEHEYVYDLSLLVKKNINDLNTKEGLKKALFFLSEHGVELDSIENYNFRVFLSRGVSYNKRENADEDNINKYYRMFDSPHNIDEPSEDSIKKGRLSYINSQKPHITLSLHINYVESQKYSGMHSFFAPSYYEFKEILNNRDNFDKLKNMPIYSFWNIASGIYPNEMWMVNDASTYFTGHRINGRFIGRRNAMINWKYSEIPSVQSEELDFDELNTSFFDREKCKYELYRRQNGPEGVGGDNLYISNEILRWVSYFLNKKDKKKVGVLPPRASDWSISIFTNSITGALELGNIYSEYDREFLINYKENIAEYISYGLLCVLNEVTIKGEYDGESPLLEKLNLQKYNDYFEEVL